MTSSSPDNLDESIDAIHYCINDLDSIIYYIDCYDPMSFLQIADDLCPVIKLCKEKWKDE